jgi:hypothetical protein
MPVNARRFIRKMRGGAQAHLLEADDDNFYIVKFQNNPQHRRILVNEVIAGEILNHLQVYSPDYRFVRISREFLDRNRDVHMQTGTRRVEVEPGWHFGSRHPGNPDTMAIYDFIPDALLGQVANSEQFRAVLVFDRWVANADGRQAVFFRALLKDWLAAPGVPPRKLGFVTLMIDHGFAFNGPHWQFVDSPVQGLYFRSTVYDDVRSLESFQPWLDMIEHFPADIIDAAWKEIPRAWMDQEDETSLERMLEYLLLRRRRVPELLTDIHKQRPAAFPNWNGKA